MFFSITRRSDKKSLFSEKDERWERVERKFFVSPPKIMYARSLMKSICVPDKKFYRGTINSLYFDTPDLREYEKSDDGDYKREKIRIRWYDYPSIDEMVPVYLELKAKKGFASKKKRRKFIVPAKEIYKYKLGGSILNKSEILQTLAEFNYFPQGQILPSIMISYDRLRFTEIMTGTRMSFDWNIRSVPTHQIPGHSFSNIMLQGAVIEIKGTIMDIPISLQPLHNTCIDWSRFSKYAGCIESHIETNGSIGHAWPSGRTESQ